MAFAGCARTQLRGRVWGWGRTRREGGRVHARPPQPRFICLCVCVQAALAGGNVSRSRIPHGGAAALLTPPQRSCAGARHRRTPSVRLLTISFLAPLWLSRSPRSRCAFATKQKGADWLSACCRPCGWRPIASLPAHAVAPRELLSPSSCPPPLPPATAAHQSAANLTRGQGGRGGTQCAHARASMRRRGHMAHPK